MGVVTRPPLPSRLVLLSAILLPASGQVLNRQPGPALMFLLFILLLGGFTRKTAGPDVSVVGKLAGGIFVHAIAIYDAYKVARIRQEVWNAARRSGGPRTVTSFVHGQADGVTPASRTRLRRATSPRTPAPSRPSEAGSGTGDSDTPAT